MMDLKDLAKKVNNPNAAAATAAAQKGVPTPAYGGWPKDINKQLQSLQKILAPLGEAHPTYLYLTSSNYRKVTSTEAEKMVLTMVLREGLKAFKAAGIKF